MLDALSQGQSGHILNRRLFVTQRMSSFTAEMKKISFLQQTLLSILVKPLSFKPGSQILVSQEVLIFVVCFLLFFFPYNYLI